VLKDWILPRSSSLPVREVANEGSTTIKIVIKILNNLFILLAWAKCRGYVVDINWRLFAHQGLNYVSPKFSQLLTIPLQEMVSCTVLKITSSSPQSVSFSFQSQQFIKDSFCWQMIDKFNSSQETINIWWSSLTKFEILFSLVYENTVHYDCTSVFLQLPKPGLLSLYIFWSWKHEL